LISIMARLAHRLGLVLALAGQVGCQGDALIGADQGPRGRRAELSPLGGPCDGEKHCDSCRACAAGERCTTEVAQCNAIPACVELVQCLEGCGGDDGCAAKCNADGAAGLGYQEAIEDCVRCECMSDCHLTESCLGI
jgi:hypothetical protein